MITIHRPSPDEINGQRDKGYTVGIADTRNATFFLSEALNQDSDFATNNTSPRSALKEWHRLSKLFIKL